jgi:hypothetical protein
LVHSLKIVFGKVNLLFGKGSGAELSISAEHIRLDRIYHEVDATGGDIQALWDLFGVSIANAARWTATMVHIAAVLTLNAKAQPLDGR